MFQHCGDGILSGNNGHLVDGEAINNVFPYAFLDLVDGESSKQWFWFCYYGFPRS
jgi:hypothetical protein